MCYFRKTIISENTSTKYEEIINSKQNFFFKINVMMHICDEKKTKLLITAIANDDNRYAVNVLYSRWLKWVS